MIRIIFFGFLLAVVGVVGCQPSGLSGLVPLKGMIFWDDQPLAGAQIIFDPEEGQRSASAVSLDNGSFAATTLKYNDGIYPGKYRISVAKTEVIDHRTPEQKARDESSEIDESHARIPPSPELVIKAIVPEKYNDFNTSGLTVEVGKSGQRNFELRLTSQ